MYSRKVWLSVFIVYYKGGAIKEYACVGKITAPTFLKKIEKGDDVLSRVSQICAIVGDDRYLITKAPSEGLLCVEFLGHRTVQCSMGKEFFVHMSDQEM